MKGKNLKYSGQAKTILENLNENSINIDKFEKWVEENKFIVGGGYIVEYLELIAREIIPTGG